MRLALLLITVVVYLNLVEAGKANGKICRKGSQCNSTHCCNIPGKWFKQCQECCTNWDCPSGQVCSGFNCVDESSVDPGTPGDNKPNGDTCNKDDDCASGNCCGFWKWKRCRECCRNSDCPTGVCKNNVCYEELSFGARCKKNDDLCADPMKCCKEGLWTSRCRYCCNDQDCTNPSTPYCESGQCSANAPAGSSCATNPCQSGLTCCQSNQICNQCCVVGGLSFDCPSGSYCSHFNCVKQWSSGMMCLEHYECKSNHCVKTVVGATTGECA